MDFINGKIKQLRYISNMSQKEFASFLGISPNTLSKIETGERSISSDIYIIKNLCALTGLSLDELFLDEKIKDANSASLKTNILIHKAASLKEESLDLLIKLVDSLK